MAEFTWIPSYSTQMEQRPIVLQAQFGDGYEQRAAAGQNNLPRRFRLTFSTLGATDADAIIAFLRARAGTEAFDWTPPHEAASARFKCVEPWARTFEDGDLMTVQTTFEEVFEP